MDSLAHLKRRITEEKKAQLLTWHGQMTKEREGRKSGFYVPCLKTQIDPRLGKTKKVLYFTVSPTESKPLYIA